MRTRPRGFALVVSVLMMVLVSLLAVALLGLSTLELRRATTERDLAAARAHARLALTEAIGQLQREMGPDQRVSASSELLGAPVERHWTGVWASVREDGSPFLERDPDTGSWLDRRVEEGWDRETEARAWLVSGGAEPRAGASGPRVRLVGPGSVGQESGGEVEVPLVDLNSAGELAGRLAWWTGDLGTRANIASPDRHADAEPDPAEPGRGFFRLLASQQAEPGLIGVGIELDPDQRRRLPSAGTVELAAEPPAGWSGEHFHDYTVFSQGVLADVRDGGLRRDLSAYLESGGRIEPWRGLRGVEDNDLLLAEAGQSRHQRVGPRFGLLRDWVRSAAPFSGKQVVADLPGTDPEGGRESEALALCNETPTRLDGQLEGGLQPVLVEATNYLQISAFPLTESYPFRFQLRHHLYPRVVLWNPYNVELEFDPAVVMIQGNGRQEMWTENEHYNSRGQVVFRSQGQWLSFEGGRSTSFNVGGKGIMESDGYVDPYMGSYYFSVPATTFGPGETLVFPPAYSAEYDGLSAYRPGSYDLSANQLSCEVSPDPSRSFYVSSSDIGGGVSYRPVKFWYAPTPYWSNDGQGVKNQSDDTRVVMKALDGEGPVTFERFDALPQLAYISASLQYGAGREPRIAWDDQSKMDIELLDRINPRPTLPPDVRTREGIRMRWFDEHFSNIVNAGALAGSPRFFEESPFATWNPRASYAVRSPWENLGGSLPSVGSAGGPWFFGIFTRDLYDGSVSWGEQVPVFRDGRYHGNPFGPPQEGRARNAVFELPRQETGLVSMGQFQNAKLSEFVWHPSFAFGNSLVDPRLGLDHMDRTVPPTNSKAEDSVGGFYRGAIGWSSDSQRSSGRNAWANTGRSLLQEMPESDYLSYDLSFEVNRALWDGYFVSSGDRLAKAALVADPVRHPLPNGRMLLSPWSGPSPALDRVAGFHTAARHLVVDGAFNVNSTRVEAWKAVLAATRETGGGESHFARVLAPVEGEHRDGDSAADDSAWAGRRALSDREIERLAEAIVEEVETRGPFLSLSDFVNRRLSNDETGRRGALQAAIDRAGINAAFEDRYPLDNGEPLGDYKHPDNIEDSTRLEQTLKPSTMAWGAPGFLTQGDVLQVLGPMLSARSDSFVIRAYGESVGKDGEVRARAWCEAVVQRTPEPIEADESGINPEDAGEPGDFGRRFELVSFRWLRPEEV